MERAEHLKWCKTRALEAANQGDLTGAVASMMSDLQKHEAWNDPMLVSTLGMLGIMDAQRGDTMAVKRWIEGFN